ncbi:MrcB family domain-containing protein [Neobacillus terrae]|uniref:MrcB family domain-containing protein n=1 Tax=Neobacillus terrae TaxID=3034837 RepID=UPI00140860BE|nr:DUF3578 domain-containing protein [Neobacillus terrae]NHM30663.1 DUF3578 domain-containing protein [Neobacillus terrae]
MIEKVLLALSGRVRIVSTWKTNKQNRITKVDSTGIYVETEPSLEKYKTGEKSQPSDFISHDFLLTAWHEFTSARIASVKDFVKTQRRSSFIMAFFSQLPFVEVINKNGVVAIRLKEFKTDDIPCEQFHKVITFLDEVVAGVYDPKTLSNQIDGNLYRIKSKGRQDLRILQLLSNNNEIIEESIEEYKQTPNKNQFIKQQVLKHEYFNIALYCLDLLSEQSKVDKRKALEELGMLIIRNSMGSNLMVESVAKERTLNLLNWLKSVDLVDDNWTPIENGKIVEEGERMETKLRDGFLRVMNEYLEAKREGFGGHPFGAFVRSQLPNEINKLPFISSYDYVVTGSVGQGNWATIPWIAIMNNKITTSTQRGYYIVYLFSEDMQQLYLTFAQGVTETTKEEMLRIKNEIRSSIVMSERVKKDDDINLGTSTKAKQYALSTAAYISYNLENMPPENQLVDDLHSMIQYYKKYIRLKGGNELQVKDPITPYEHSDNDLNMKDLVNHIHSFIASKGFFYTLDEVTNLFLSLKSKPFVILSGISGTGKTKMVQWFAESIGANEENGQFSLIPVRPDWNDGSDLLGYVDIKGDFKEGPLTKVIKNAIQNPRLPFFVLLDEMNLARVEHYFSDILSVMESRKWDNGEMITSTLLSKEITGEEEDLRLPSNVYVIGTVNMDETTHPFSKKVLDRANTIEFNRVELGNLSFLMELEEKCSISIAQGKLASEFLHLKDVYNLHPELVEKVTIELVEINKSLQQINAHVGYRVRDEICFYMAYNQEGQLMSFEKAFDHCILQKILPRISGSDNRVESLLKDLFKQFTKMEYVERQSDSEYNIENALHPNSAAKVLEMLRRLQVDGFTSFWIS